VTPGPLATTVGLWSSALGGVGLALAGEFEAGGIGLVVLALLVLVAARPFARLSPRARVAARLAATGAVVVATVIAVLAIGRAANPRA
jgi:hypothetical protein